MRGKHQASELRARAEEAKARRDFRRALRLYQALCECSPHDPVGPHRVGEILHRLGRPTEALRRLEQAADLYARQGFLGKTSALYRIMLQIRPDQPEVVATLRAVEAKRLAGDAEPSPSASRAHPEGSAPPRRPRPPADSLADTEEVELLLDLSPVAHLQWHQNLNLREVTATGDGFGAEGESASGSGSRPLAEVHHLDPLHERLGDLEAIPVLARAPHDIDGVDPEELSVLAWVDGRRTCAEVAATWGAARAEALRLLLQLRDAGLVLLLKPARHEQAVGA